MSSWPFEFPEDLALALQEQDENEEEIKALAPVLWDLGEWQAPVASPAEIQTVIRELASLAPAFSQNIKARPRSILDEIGWLLKIARLQVSILRPAFWLVSGIVMAAGVVLIFSQPGSSPALVLQALGPFLAYLGTISAFRGLDAGMLEFELACPPSPRLLTLARLTVVLVYDTLLGCLASLLLRGNTGENLLALILYWLAPLLLVNGLALMAALLLPVAKAAGIACGSWLAFILIVEILPARGEFAPITAFAEILLVSGGLFLMVLAILFQPRALVRRLPSH